MVDLGKSRLLIQSVSKKWTQTCEGQVPVEMEVCPFCIIELACCCELRNSNIYIPPVIVELRGGLKSHSCHSDTKSAIYI